MGSKERGKGARMQDKEQGWRTRSKERGQGARMEDREQGWRIGSRERREGARTEGREQGWRIGSKDRGKRAWTEDKELGQRTGSKNSTTGGSHTASPQRIPPDAAGRPAPPGADAARTGTRTRRVPRSIDSYPESEGIQDKLLRGRS